MTDFFGNIKNWFGNTFSNSSTSVDSYSYRDDISIPSYYNPVYQPYIIEDFGGGKALQSFNDKSWFERLKSGVGGLSEIGGRFFGSAIAGSTGLFQRGTQTVPQNQTGMPPMRKDDTPSKRTAQTGVYTGGIFKPSTEKTPLKSTSQASNLLANPMLLAGVGLAALVFLVRK